MWQRGTCYEYLRNIHAIFRHVQYGGKQASPAFSATASPRFDGTPRVRTVARYGIKLKNQRISHRNPAA
jgi:hypothetical protein